MARKLSDEVKRLYERELELELYNVEIYKVPIFRIIRFAERARFLNKHFDFFYNSKKKEIKLFGILHFFVKSFFQFIKLVIQRPKVQSIFFSFPRLAKNSKEYFDKFTDPVINLSGMQDFLIFQRNLGGEHFLPRQNRVKVIYSDFVDYLVSVFSLILSPFILPFFCRKLTRFVFKLNELNKISVKVFISVLISVCRFTLYLNIYICIFKFLKVQKIFVVSREIFIPIITAAKFLNITVYEFQHGITTQNTPLYTGFYNHYADPDYFLVFGEFWINNMFGINKERIRNIGWAYNEFIPEIDDKLQKYKNAVLIISSPEITKEIFQFVNFVSDIYKSGEVHLKLHPQESLSYEQLRNLEKCSNVKVIPKELDSQILIQMYDKVIGENSTVLYEALYLNKFVAKVNMFGLNSFDYNIDDELGFFLIRVDEDLIDFLNSNEGKKKSNVKSIYSQFSKDYFNFLIKN